MMFRGTKAYPPEAYKAIVTRIGARQNAYTSDDLTNYHITFAKEDLEKDPRDRGRPLQEPRLLRGGVQDRRRARSSASTTRTRSNPLRKLVEVQRDSAFRAHTYKHTTMGFLEDIEDMPNQYEYSKTFFARWYRPENATIVVVAGDVDAARRCSLVEKRYFGKLGRRGSHRVEIPREPPPHGPVYAHVPWTTPTLPWVAVAFHGPAFSDVEKDWPAMDLLFDLPFGETSDLYKRLVVEEQKVDALFADSGANVDPGLVTVYARLK